MYIHSFYIELIVLVENISLRYFNVIYNEQINHVRSTNKLYSKNSYVDNNFTMTP